MLSAGRHIQIAARAVPRGGQMPKRRAAEAEERRLTTFVGFLLSNGIQARLTEELQGWMTSGRANGKPERQEKLHVTLKYIGATPESAVQPLLQDLRLAMSNHRPVTVSIQGLGSFGQRRGHIVWAGVEDLSGELASLAATAEQVAEDRKLGKKERRPYRPHVTLTRDSRDPPWCSDISGELRFGNMAVEAVELFESRDGSYISLGSAPLQGGQAAVDGAAAASEGPAFKRVKMAEDAKEGEKDGL